MNAGQVKHSPWLRLRRAWDRLVVYLPLLVMAVMAMTTYWLVRTTPILNAPELEAAPRHVPDYFMHDFSIRVFDASGRLLRELHGKEGRHYPDTDTLEIDQVRIRTLHPTGRETNAHADRGITNADGTEMQLFDHAVVVREAQVNVQGVVQQPRVELRSEFLHFFADTEVVRSHLPVEMVRGKGDRFTGDRMTYDNLGRVMQLEGRVRGVLEPRHRKP